MYQDMICTRIITYIVVRMYAEVKQRWQRSQRGWVGDRLENDNISEISLSEYFFTLSNIFILCNSTKMLFIIL